MSYSPSGLASYVSLHRGQESVTVPIWKQTAGEFPYPEFSTLYNIYVSDPDMYAAVNFIANRALSHGWHIECAETADPSYREDAEEFLTDWLNVVQWGDRRNETGFTPLLRNMTREMGWGGNSILEMIPGPEQIEKFAQVQLTSIWKAQRDDTGALTALWQQMSINPRALTPSKYIIYSWMQQNREPFAKGLLQPVSQPKPNMINGGWIPPLIAIKWQMEDDARRRLHVQASPHTIFGIPGLSVNEQKSMAEAIRQAPADERFITNVPVNVATDVPTGRGTFQAEFDLLDAKIKSATGNVLTEMLTGKGFSYASAVKAGSLGDEIVWDMQAVIASNTENWILSPLLEQNGFDAVLLKPKLVWNIPDNPQEWTIADLNAAYQNGAITLQDFIRNAKQFGKWDLDDPVPMQPMAPPMGQDQNVAMPGNLITNPAQALDPQAYANMMQIQSEIEALRKQLSSLEALAAVSVGMASTIDSPQRKKHK